MAIKKIRRTWANELNDHVEEYIADYDSDVPNLPEAAPSSTCIVAESATIQIVNASGDWGKFGK